MQMPAVSNYGRYSSENYGAHTLVFTDAQGRDFYYSYKTLVAIRSPETGLVVRENEWGPTTGKHLNWIDGGDHKNRVDSSRFEEIVFDLEAVPA